MKKVIIKQVRSSIGRTGKQKATLESLGLGKIGSSREIEVNPITQGMINKVAFMIDIEEKK